MLSDLECAKVSKLLAEISPRYPIVLTRRPGDRQAMGPPPCARLSAFRPRSVFRRPPPETSRIDIRVEIDPVHWFLNDADDTRSSYYLEDPATEFQVQGLELDWVCLTWDADLRFAGAGWD